MMKRIWNIAIVCLMVGVSLSVVRAYDFSATVDGNRLYFNIIDKEKKTASVTYPGSVKGTKTPSLKGEVKIPAKVKHNNAVYTISEIGSKAFAGESALTGVSIPDGVVAVRDFAFQDCDSLKNITFPANPVKFGDGAFFRCSQIEDVVFGAEWTDLNLEMFRWSNRLDSISIPAKVADIHGLGKLKSLSHIHVDADNLSFSSRNGFLYDKSGLTLLRCPRGYAGSVVVAEATETIADGAFAGCNSLISIQLPSTLKSISFRETASLLALQNIILLAENPILNAFSADGNGYFLLLLPNPDMTISVPTSSLKTYAKSLPTLPGEYTLTPDGIPYTVNKDQLPTKKNLKGIK